MSLRFFHVFFITASILLALMMVIWSVATGSWLLGVLAFAGGAGLAVYEVSFLRRTRHIDL